MDDIIQIYPRQAEASKQCPQCGQKGRWVETQTVKAMLAITLHAIRAKHYYFCQTADCSVVYFAADGEESFSEGELREKVYQKHLNDEHPNDKEIPICYCFHHTPHSIRQEWEQSGQSNVVESITIGTQTGQCACDIRNPQGSCCLGNVRRFVEQMKQGLS